MWSRLEFVAQLTTLKGRRKNGRRITFHIEQKADGMGV